MLFQCFFSDTWHIPVIQVTCFGTLKTINLLKHCRKGRQTLTNFSEVNAGRTDKVKCKLLQTCILWTKTFKLVNIPLNVALRKTNVTDWLLLCVILTSKIEKDSFFANFEINLMFGCLVFL